MGIHPYGKEQSITQDVYAELAARASAERFRLLPMLPTHNVSTFTLMTHFDECLLIAYPGLGKADRADLVKACIKRYDQARNMTYASALATVRSAVGVKRAQEVARAEAAKAYESVAQMVVDDDEDGTEAEQIAAAPFTVNFWGRVVPRNRA